MFAATSTVTSHLNKDGTAKQGKVPQTKVCGALDTACKNVKALEEMKRLLNNAKKESEEFASDSTELVSKMKSSFQELNRGYVLFLRNVLLFLPWTLDKSEQIKRWNLLRGGKRTFPGRMIRGKAMYTGGLLHAENARSLTSNVFFTKYC